MARRRYRESLTYSTNGGRRIVNVPGTNFVKQGIAIICVYTMLAPTAARAISDPCSDDCDTGRECADYVSAN